MEDDVIDIFNDVVWGFEGEHIFAQQLWSDDDRAEFLESLGYERDMLGNLMGLFADQETVDRLQALPSQHPLRLLLMDPNSGFGLTWHKGGPIASGNGGFQRSKNAFLIDQIDRIRDAVDQDGKPVSDEAKKAAVDNLFDWTWRLAKGEIVDENNRPLGVMGDDAEFERLLRDTFRTGEQAASINPADVDRINPQHPNYDPAFAASVT